MNWERFDEALRGRGWKQKQLATALGIPEPKVSRWKSGEQEMRVRELMDVAETLRVSPGWLLGENPAPGAGLNDMEQTLLELGRRLGLREALIRLSLNEPGGSTGRAEERDPKTGGPPPSTPKGRRA